MSDKNHILLVDDDLMMQELEKHQLGHDNYRFSSASDGLEALSLLGIDKPDVILLDIVMPGMDGLDTCRRIRADEDNADIYIIFVTSKDDDETRLMAYEAGGDDVLIKPLNFSVINRKVEAAVRSRKMVKGLRQEVNNTLGVLMSTIVTSGEYGVVMNFFRSSYACKSVAELAEVVLTALDEFGLTGSVQIRSGECNLTLNTEHRSSPLEQAMLLKLTVENRHIYDYGNRSAFCYPNVAILIKSMPLDDPEAYGRIKDNIALLAEGAEFRLNALIKEMAVRRQREALASSVALASQVLGTTTLEFKSDQSEMSELFNQLEGQLEWAFAGLGLSDDQEAGMWSIVRPLVARANALYERGIRIDEQLGQAVESLRRSLDDRHVENDCGQEIWLVEKDSNSDSA